MFINPITYGESDYHQLLDLRHRVMRAPLGLEFSKEELALEAGYIHLAAIDDGVVIGGLVLIDLGHHLFKVRQMVVTPERQGQGIGRALLELALDISRSHGGKKIKLDARIEATGFYKTIGFHNVGEAFMEIGIPHQLMEIEL